jgi:hypothetical protein
LAAPRLDAARMPYSTLASAESFADFLGSHYVKNDIIANGLNSFAQLATFAVASFILPHVCATD